MSNRSINFPSYTIYGPRRIVYQIATFVKLVPPSLPHPPNVMSPMDMRHCARHALGSYDCRKHHNRICNDTPYGEDNRNCPLAHPMKSRGRERKIRFMLFWYNLKQFVSHRSGAMFDQIVPSPNIQLYGRRDYCSIYQYMKCCA